MGIRRLQSGQVGERMAEMYFVNNGWIMTRTQPSITILGMISPAMAYALKRFIPRLATFGHMVIGRMGQGGVPDYTGYQMRRLTQFYLACEVKECAGDSMPASRVSKEQRAFLSALPMGSAHVGIFWTDSGKFSMHPFLEKGSYKNPQKEAKNGVPG
jgi:hypothetical protein